MPDIGAKCSELLAAFQSDAYLAAFQFLDHLRDLGKQEPEIVGLEQQLVQRLAVKSHERISIAFPEVSDEELLDHYKLTSGWRRAELEELTLEECVRIHERIEIEPDPQSILIVGNRRRRRTGHQAGGSLREYLICEIDQEGETFIFCLVTGSWRKMITFNRFATKSPISQI